MRSNFFERYFSVLRMALSSGWEAKPLVGSRVQANTVSHREVKEFRAACHRGYEKAQNRIVEMLCEINAEQALNKVEKEFQIVLLRKVADTIAAVLFQHRIHYMRRLLLHTKAPAINISTLIEAHNESKRLNNESRQTFALLADLTTFVHIADIIRIDFRRGEPQVSLLELKSGRINTILLEQLKRHEPKPESLTAIRNDIAIKPGHLKQAERMLRQQIRHHQLQEIARTDRGVDFLSGKQVVWSKNETEVDSYDAFLEQLCSEAEANGFGAGTVDECLHLGVGFSEQSADARSRAIACLNSAIVSHTKELPKGFTEALEEIESHVPKPQRFLFLNLFESNLAALAVRPFLHWSLDSSHMYSLIKRQLVVILAFDVAGFLWLCRNIGFRMKFGTKRQAAEHQQAFGRNNIITWGGRELLIEADGETSSIGGGMLSRFTNDLSRPRAFMTAVYKAKFERHS